MGNEQHERDVNAAVPFRVKAEAAIIGAAVGDALGWPEEGRATLATRKAPGSKRGEFVSWSRRAGGRFYAYEEEIGRGEYSDDTQLIAATARSLIESGDWYRALIEIELPFWTAYERGGGGATKRAAESWLSGRPPWDGPVVDQRRYFEAGGNGVVMRILPHCIWERYSANYSIVANEIARNGICTHGHPRALIGALAYGFAVWHQLRSTETLGYGALLDMLLEAQQVWSALPDSIANLPGWLVRAEDCFGGRYRDLWHKTVDEQLGLLRMAKEGMAKGALAVDQEVLRSIGCFDKRVSGSGTIAAAAAVFLSSRYAADPMNGVQEAAYSRGADTDTLASLVGGLLGAVNGMEWIGPLGLEIQDVEYLRSLARDLCERTPRVESDRKRITGPTLEPFLRGLPDLIHAQSVNLPTGQAAKVLSVARQPVGSGRSDRVVVQCRTDSGQKLYLHKFMKAGNSAMPDRQYDKFEPVKVERFVVRLRVRDIEQSKRFYVSALGMKIDKESPGLVTLAGVLALSSRDGSRDQQLLPFGGPENSPIHVYIETSDLEAAHRNLQVFVAKRLTAITPRDIRRHFTCLDPDGNVVEVFELRSGKSVK